MVESANCHSGLCRSIASSRGDLQVCDCQSRRCARAYCFSMKSDADALEHGLSVRSVGKYGKACTWLKEAHTLMAEAPTECTLVSMSAEERAVSGE